MAHTTSLPAEIRNLIITLAVVGQEPIENPEDSAEASLYVPPLAYTCTTLRAETLPIFYGQTRWQVYELETGIGWLKRLHQRSEHTPVRAVLLFRVAGLPMYSFFLREDTNTLNIQIPYLMASQLPVGREAALSKRVSALNETHASSLVFGRRREDRILGMLEWMVAEEGEFADGRAIICIQLPSRYTR